MDDADALALFGTTQPVPADTRLSAGALSCLLCEGELREVRWGEVEIARGIAYLLRDRDWGTVPATVSQLKVEQTPERFEARFELRMLAQEGELACRVHIAGDAGGQLVFEVDATAGADIETNRCGFVLLHPASAAGKSLRVEHTGGRSSETSFPRQISPSQPVLDIRALHYEPSHKLALSCRLEAMLPGDPAGKFEMEDQRNWSDASFKTYVASLFDPWPYRLPAGVPLTQRVHLHARGIPAAASSRNRLGPPLITFGSLTAKRMPAIGVGVPPGLHCARAEEVDALRALGAGWWIVEAELADPAVARDLSAVATHRGGLPVEVQLDVVVPAKLSPARAAELAAALCAEVGLVVDAVRLLPAPLLKSFQPSDRWPELPPLQDYSREARRFFPNARVGGGMFTYFTELNRKRPSAKGLDFIGHATCPIVHAPDERSVMQTFEVLPHIVRSVQSLWPGLPYRLGPNAIAMRRNPYGDGPTPNAQGLRLAMAASDPRHDASFGAAWTAAYAATVAPFGLELLGLHDSHGPRGPLGTRVLNIGNEHIGVVPSWSVLKCLAQAAGAHQVPITGLGHELVALAWSPDHMRIEGIIANMTAKAMTMRCSRPVRFDGELICDEVRLEPYGTARFDIANN